jgi:hypothetical protein
MSQSKLSDLMVAMLAMIEDSELVAEFDDRVVISVVREDFEEVRQLMREFD